MAATARLVTDLKLHINWSDNTTDEYSLTPSQDALLCIRLLLDPSCIREKLTLTTPPASPPPTPPLSQPEKTGRPSSFEPSQKKVIANYVREFCRLNGKLPMTKLIKKEFNLEQNQRSIRRMVRRELGIAKKRKK